MLGVAALDDVFMVYKEFDKSGLLALRLSENDTFVGRVEKKFEKSIPDMTRLLGGMCMRGVIAARHKAVFGHRQKEAWTAYCAE